MSITLLRTLIAVAETGSFKAAAARVHVSQAAVGQQMRRLEDLYEAPLFDRAAKPPSLTPLALSLIPDAREVIAGYDALLGGSNATSLSGTLTLGAVPSTLRGLVPMALKRLMQSTPELQVRVVPGLSNDLAEQVERGALDAAITSARPAGPAFQITPIAFEPLVLITATDTPDTTPSDLLRTLPYIRHTRRAAAGQIAEDWLARRGIAVRSSMELESLETVASAVSHGLGISVVPDICVPDAVFASLRKIPLDPPDAGRALCLMARSDSAKAQLIARLMDEVASIIATYKS